MPSWDRKQRLARSSGPPEDVGGRGPSRTLNRLALHAEIVRALRVVGTASARDFETTNSDLKPLLKKRLHHLSHRWVWNGSRSFGRNIVALIRNPGGTVDVE